MKAYNLTVTAPGAAFDAACARVLADALIADPQAVVGLSTGRTTGGIHRALVRLVVDEGINVRQATFFGLDEVTGVPESYPGSCVYMLRHECIEALGVDSSRFLMLPTHSMDWPRDCERFRRELAERGGVTLLELGLGENGHMGFNQPGTPFTQRAFHGRMHDDLEERVRREAAVPQSRNVGGVTLGVADILEARSILLCANGARKRGILRQALYGPVTEAVPASALQKRGQLQIICDTEADPR